MKTFHRRRAERFRKKPAARRLIWAGLVGLTVAGAAPLAIAGPLIDGPAIPLSVLPASADDDAHAPRKEKDSRLRMKPAPGNSIAARTGIELPPLEQDDPRWARSGSNVRTANRASEGRSASGADGGAELQARMAGLARYAASRASTTDRTATAAILRVETQAPKTAAARGTPTAAPENNRIGATSNPFAYRNIPSPAPEQPAQFGPPKPKPPAKIAAIDPEAPVEPAAPKREARTTAAVNLRAGAGASASIITVVPTGASVGIIDCGVRCEVVYEGKRGWVHSDFVSGYGSPKAGKPAAPRKPQKKSSVGRTVASVTSEAQKGAQNTGEVGFFKSLVRGCVECGGVARPPVPQSP